LSSLMWRVSTYRTPADVPGRSARSRPDIGVQSAPLGCVVHPRGGCHQRGTPVSHQGQHGCAACCGRLARHRGAALTSRGHVRWVGAPMTLPSYPPRASSRRTALWAPYPNAAPPYPVAAFSLNAARVLLFAYVGCAQDPARGRAPSTRNTFPSPCVPSPSATTSCMWCWGRRTEFVRRCPGAKSCCSAPSPLSCGGASGAPSRRALSQGRRRQRPLVQPLPLPQLLPFPLPPPPPLFPAVVEVGALVGAPVGSRWPPGTPP
jgi:hypothetical protein